VFTKGRRLVWWVCFAQREKGSGSTLHLYLNDRTCLFLFFFKLTPPKKEPQLKCVLPPSRSLNVIAEVSAALELVTAFRFERGPHTRQFITAARLAMRDNATQRTLEVAPCDARHVTRADTQVGSRAGPHLIHHSSEPWWR